MKNYFKYSMLITLVLLITVSLVPVQAPAPAIGTTEQPHPYESNPSSQGYFAVGTPNNPSNMRDGNLANNGDFNLGANITGLRPNADVSGITQGWTKSSGTTNYENVDDSDPHDGNSTYIYQTATSYKQDIYEIQNVTDPVGGVTSVTVKAYAMKIGGTGTIQLSLRVGGTYYHSTSKTPTTGNYALIENTWTTNPKWPAIGWNWTGVNILQAGVRGYNPTATPSELRVTQVYVNVLGTAGYYELKIFDNTPTTSFSIGFVDIKMKYQVSTALTDDTYRIEYTVSPSTTWTTLQADTGDAYDRAAAHNPAIRPWSQVSEPNGGGWSWTDVGNLRVRVYVTRGGSLWDVRTMNVFEVWASVYPLPTPPSGGTPSVHLAVIPSAIYNIKATQYLFVDIYVTGASAMTGYAFFLLFDNLTLTPNSVFIYDPFHYQAPAAPELNDTRGWVVIQQAMPLGESVGFTGSEPVARIYFTVDQWGTSKLNIVNSTEKTGPPGLPAPIFASMITTTTVPTGIPHQVHDGWVSAPRYLSAIDNSGNPTQITLTSPTNTRWREIYPNYGAIWNLTSWEDMGTPTGELSHSDQIDMLNASRYKYWFHVDVVTITIHYSNTSTGKSGKAEPTTPSNSLPTDPTGTTWHQLWNGSTSGFSITFTIINWIDGDADGTFEVSELFEYEYAGGGQDVLLVGTAPSVGSTLTAPDGDAHDMFYDAGGNVGTWDPGEPAIRDVNLDGYYYASDDVVLAGNAPADGVALSWPSPSDMYYDANTNGDWDVGEPAIRDADSNGVYSPKVTYWAHLDYVSTDILASPKDIPPVYVPPAIPEFPLGTEIIMILAPLTLIIYLWRTRPKRRV